MIVTGDIEDILLNDLKPFGLPTYKKDAIPEGKVTSDRITVIPHSLKDGTYWKKDFVEVNFQAPDIEVAKILMADKERLKELERLAGTLDSVSVYDGTVYRYSGTFDLFD
jgi:hypothetical protein